jgi:hypothetical protein|tara:strand:- start:748 stop:1770 length:1023 start_codon:yes stop_codon:yes gene_type:complete
MGKNNVAPPDYAPLAEASAEAARIQTGLGREQLDFARQQYDRSAPILEGIARQQMSAQNEQMTQARDYYNYQKDTYRPLERSIVQDAEQFNTEAYRNDLASQAAADAGQAFGISQQQNQRAMSSMGVNPNSGRFAGMQKASELQQSAARANVMTGTRSQAQQMGYARKLDAAGLGRGLAGASAAAYGGASAAGSMAGGNAQSAGQNYMGNMSIGAGTMGAGQQMQLQGLGNVLNNQTQTYINTSGSFMGDLGGILGGAASAYTAFGSDRKIKENIEEVGVDQRTALTLYEFNYIGDTTRRFRGVMADEVEMVFPTAVIDTDLGFKAVDYGALGIEFREVA